MAFEYCSNHPQSRALWRCGACQKNFCQQCIREDQFSDTVIQLCPQCAGRCEAITPVEQEAPAKPFALQLADAFVYPFRGPGKFIMPVIAVLFLLAWVLNLFMRGAGLIIYIPVWLYMGAYALKTIRETAGGDNDPPNGPDASNFWDDLLRPLLLVIATVLFSFLPFFAYLPASGTEWGQMSLLGWVLFAFGVLYFPMGLTSVALRDSVAGLNPVHVIVSIVKVGPAYVLACGFFAAFMFLERVVGSSSVMAVPLLGAFLSGAIVIYFLLAEMRICGLVYSAYEKKLNWF